MEYFERSEPEQNLLDNTICEIKSSLNIFYSAERTQDEFIRLHSSTLGEEELLAFTRSYLEGNITVGKYNNEYENLSAEYFHSRYSVTSNSGSSANLLAISALVQAGKLNKGDKVIVPSLAWSTTIFPLVQYGLIPVFVDISTTDFNLSLVDVESCTREHDIKAIMVIHTYGNPADIDFLTNFCDSNNLLLIEDTCESMGATWDAKPIGSFGILGTFSTYFSHHICTLEGGLTITDDENLLNLMKSIRSHGWTRDIKFDSSLIENVDFLDPTFTFLNTGYNIRLSDPQAAIGCIQLKKLDKFVTNRARNAQKFKELISNSSLLGKYITSQKSHEKASSSWFGFPILLKDLKRNQVQLIRKKLLERGIESRPFLAGDFTLQPVNLKYKSIKFVNQNNIRLFHNLSFALPCHQGLTSQHVENICSSLELSLREVIS